FRADVPDFSLSIHGAGPKPSNEPETSPFENPHLCISGCCDWVNTIHRTGRAQRNTPRRALLGLARRCGNVPPSIGVVSRLQHVDIPPGPRGCFGFELASGSPPRVASVSPESPAAACGIEPGDYVLEVNGMPVMLQEAAVALVGSLTYSFALQERLETHGGRSLSPACLDVPSKFEHVIPQTF
uniref:PDZ domain-containing protein n=1 Tax=Accipiter nisus TaxID=211598 RepID=A0A8B9MAD1_9AVES